MCVCMRVYGGGVHVCECESAKMDAVSICQRSHIIPEPIQLGIVAVCLLGK